MMQVDIEQVSFPVKHRAFSILAERLFKVYFGAVKGYLQTVANSICCVSDYVFGNVVRLNFAKCSKVACNGGKGARNAL